MPASWRALMLSYHLSCHFFNYAKRSSIVTSLWTILLCLPSTTPYVVIKVWTKAFLFFVAVRNMPARSRNFISYSLSMVNLLSLNFISHKWIILSARSISISICAPGSSSSASLCQVYIDVAIVSICNLYFICS